MRAGGPSTTRPTSCGPPVSERPAAPPVSALAEQLGGARGLLDSSLPATVFVLVRLATGSLSVAAVVALAVGGLLLALRRRRGEPLQQVASGFFGLVLAVLVARATGRGEGFFLPGIITTLLTGVFFVGSLVARRPAVALALAAYDPRYAGWRDHPRLRRACTLATAFWAATFFIRSGIAGYIYQLDGDRDGLLLVVINVVKWPLIGAAALVTVVLVRRSGFVRDGTDSAPTGSATTGSGAPHQVDLPAG